MSKKHFYNKFGKGVMVDYTECFSYNGKGDKRKNEDIDDYL